MKQSQPSQKLISLLSLPRPHGWPKSSTPTVSDSFKRKTNGRSVDKQPAAPVDNDLNLGSIESLLGMGSPEVAYSDAAPDSTQRPRRKYTKKPKCTMCRSKKAKVRQDFCHGARCAFLTQRFRSATVGIHAMAVPRSRRSAPMRKIPAMRFLLLGWISSKNQYRSYLLKRGKGSPKLLLNPAQMCRKS